MKLLATILSLVITSNAMASDVWSCFLTDVPYRKSPVVRVEKVQNKDKWQTKLTITKDTNSYTKLLDVVVTDHSEDVLALYKNKKAGVELSYYMDESDVMGFAEGTIKSPVMNGSLRCAFER